MKKLLLLAAFVFAAHMACAGQFRFAVLTDLHIRTYDSLSRNDLAAAVKQINATPGIDFILVTGDLTESGDRASLLLAKEILDGLTVKYYAISGNHETKWSESGATDFGAIFGSERFEFEHEGYLFLGFGTGPVIRMMDGHVAPQDIAWLRERLARDPEKPALLVTHYPLQPEDVDNWYEVSDAVRGFNVKAFLGGHYHADRMLSYDGIPAFLCRSTLRDKDAPGGYDIFEMTQDSIVAYTCLIGGEPRRWGGYSLGEKYYTADNGGYPRPDFSVNYEYSAVREKWLVQGDYAIYASPLVYGSRVYVGDDGGYFSCHSIRNGKKMWPFATGNRIVGTADAAGNTVVFGSTDGKIYALDARTGKLKWMYECGEPVLGAARVEDGVVYIGASDHTFRALSLDEGKLLWAYDQVKGYIETRPLVYDGRVYFGAWDGHMYALDKADGSLAWKWSDGRPGMLYSPAAVWPVATGGLLFFTAPDRVMSAVCAATGETVWRTNESWVRETIALSEDGKRVYSKTMQDSVVCYPATAEAPRRIWVSNVGYGYDHAASMPVEKDGMLFGSTKNGIIFALDGETGRVLWKHKAGNSLIGTVCPLNGRECIFASASGAIGLLENVK